ncbi:MAG: hypothetical protein WA131_12640 [Desulfitobacteriaceae bacterium]
MKNQTTKKAISFLALSLFTLLLTANPLLAKGGANEQAQDAGPYHVILQTTPEVLMVNQPATFNVIVNDKSTGKPVTGAKVIMEKSTMDKGSSMGGMNMSSGMDKPAETIMHEQSSTSTMTMGTGTYMMEGMSFNQAGQWNQTFLISSPLGEEKATFPINIGKSGPNLMLIGSVAGAVVIAGLLAAMLRKKKN